MIIMGNEFETQITIAQNRENLRSTSSNNFFYVVNTWYFGHDNFFFVSGFLASIVYVTRVENSPNAILKAYFIKILRFWPVFLTGLFLYWGLTDQFLEGPFFGKHDTNKAKCSSTWYYDLFFVNNYGSPI
jgi:peptidoglycan/LPS O-acetylase OafA/YrhL